MIKFFKNFFRKKKIKHKNVESEIKNLIENVWQPLAWIKDTEEKQMKLSEIKTKLFSGVSLTDFGVRFEIFDEERKQENDLMSEHPTKYHYIINVTNQGRINILCQGFARLNIEQLNEICRVAGILKNGDMVEKYKFTVIGRHSKDFKFTITKTGHTMEPEDIVHELSQKEILLRENAELKKQNKDLYKEYEYLQFCLNESGPK